MDESDKSGLSDQGAPNRDASLGLLLLTAIVVAYSPALTGGLVWDDDAHLTKAALRGWDGLWRIWTQVGATQQYYPLLHTAFWLEAKLWGSEVVGYHLVNVLLHFVDATLIVLLVRRLNLKGAWLAGFLFALHPVHVESVAWISEQKNTLSLAFYLVSALVYLRFDEQRRQRDYVLALALFVLALLTKTVTATLPAALLVLFWWRRGRLDWRRDISPLLPWFVLAASGGLYTAWVERRIVGAEGAEFDLGAVERVLLSARVVGFYIWKLVWPANLMFTYPRWAVSAAAAWQWLFVAAIGAVAAACWRMRGSRRGPLAVLLIFGGSLFPVLGFMNVYPFRYSYVADHFQYLASVAVFVGVAAFAAAWLEGSAHVRVHSAARSSAVAVVVALGLLTWRQAATYRDAETLYRATLARNPDSWKEHNNLGLIYSRSMKRMSESVPHFEAVVRLRPDHVRAHYSLGVALFLTGRLQEAEAHFRQVLALKPASPLLVSNSHLFVGQILLSEAGRLGEAIAELRAALSEQPQNVQVRALLGEAFERAGRLSEAKVEFETAMRLAPESAAAREGLARIALRKSRGRG